MSADHDPTANPADRPAGNAVTQSAGEAGNPAVRGSAGSIPAGLAPDGNDWTSIDWAATEALARQWTTELVGFASVTNSAGETALAPWLAERLARRPAFAGRTRQLHLLKTERDPHERYALAALVRGEGPRTVILTGHYDTVSVSNYGTLAGLAFDPQALRPALTEALAGGVSAADRLALADLSSGEFWPGRGILDMKSGLAAGLAVLESFAARPGRRGNLLFLAVPDEEEGSSGMRTAARRLPGLARSWGLELVAAINLDAEVDGGDGEAGRAVFLGSVGKLLPSALVVGRPAHAGDPFAGLSAASLAAELVRAVDLNPELADPGVGGEAGPPPVTLQVYDLKPHYDVTTPEMVWCAFNLLTRTLSPQRALEAFAQVTRRALSAAVDRAEERATRWGAPLRVRAEPTVLTYAQLRARAAERGGALALAQLDALARSLAASPSLDTPRVCQQLAEAAVRLAEVPAPAAVVMFASLYYPPASLPPGPAGDWVERAAQQVTQALAQATGQSIRVRSFFAGVSDMSFLGATPDPEALAQVRANTPAWEARFAEGPESGESLAGPPLALPTLNAGPWGRDYHQRTERVHGPYSFGVLPQLVWRLADRLIAGPDHRAPGPAPTRPHHAADWPAPGD